MRDRLRGVGYRKRDVRYSLRWNEREVRDHLRSIRLRSPENNGRNRLASPSDGLDRIRISSEERKSGGEKEISKFQKKKVNIWTAPPGSNDS